MGSVSRCISTGQGLARHPIASVSALTAVLLWGTNLGYRRRRLEPWRSGGSARRRARTSLGDARSTRLLRSSFARRCMRPAVGSDSTGRSPKAAPRTSSCRRAASLSSWTDASGTGVLSTAARPRGPDPTRSSGPTRCAATSRGTSVPQSWQCQPAGSLFGCGSAGFAETQATLQKQSFIPNRHEGVRASTAVGGAWWGEPLT